MNKVYKVIWIKSLGTSVVTSEKSRSTGKVSRTATAPGVRSTKTALLFAASLFSVGDAIAACGDPSGSSQYDLFAREGSNCVANQSSYTGLNVGYVAYPNSVLTFTQPDVTLESGADKVWVMAVGATNGGTPLPVGGTVNARGNMTLNATTTGTSNTSRALYIVGNSTPGGEIPSFLVQGNLTAYKGALTAAVENAGGILQVDGTTTITTGASNLAGTADAFRNSGPNSSNTFNGLLTINVLGNDLAGGSSSGRGIVSSGGVINLNNGATIRTLAGQAMSISGGTVNSSGTIDIGTTSGTAINLSGTAQLNAVPSKLLINTTGTNAVGINLSGNSVANLGVTQINTRGDNAHGINITNSATAGSTLLLAIPPTIETHGNGSAGIKSTYSTANAVALPNFSTIITHGDNARGLDLQAPTGNFEKWTLGFQSKITTQGANASAIYLASPNGATNINSSAILSTAGNNSHGIEIGSAANGGQVLNSGTITVNGAGSHGILADNLAGDINIINYSNIKVVDGSGIVATHKGTTGGVLSINNDAGVLASDVGGMHTGIDAHATGNGSVYIDTSSDLGGYDLSTINYGINASVADAAAMLSVKNSGFIFTDGIGMALSSEGGFDIQQNITIGGNADTGIALSGTGALGGNINNQGFIVARNVGVLNNVTNPLTLNNSGFLQATEAIRVTAGMLSATNTDTGVIEGTAQAAGGLLNLDNAGTWNNTGNSLLTTLTNSGAITYSQPSGNTFKTITTNSYTGNNGEININTVLGPDNSLSDLLVINGGTASGKTGLGVTNASGSGATTTGNGIMVVKVQSGATTASDAFALSGPVKAGAYEYSLIRRNDQNWYLISDLLNPTPNITQPDPQNYRAETSLYSAMPPMAALYSAATMDSWHERIGGAGEIVGHDNNAPRLWVRLIGGSGVRHGDAQGIYGSNGPAFDYNTIATQVGGHLYRNLKANGSASLAGMYVTLGSITGDVDHVDGKDAGRARLDVYSLGGYWTHKNQHGAYVDVVAQGNYYETKASPKLIGGLRTYGTGYDISIEGGLPIQFSTAWRIEPQLQLRTMHASLNNGQDAAARVDLGSNNSLVGRAGIKLSYDSESVTAWGRVDVLNEFRGKSQITVSSLENLHAVNFSSSLQGASAALTGGIDARLSQSASLYGAASYQRAFGDSKGHAFTVQAGLKIVW